MIVRHLAGRLSRAARQFPIVTVTGPRQSGKTTLVRAAFPRHHYVSLERPDERRFALDDPRGFLARFKDRVILDEAQRAPELFSYLQGMTDDDPRAGRFILSGSQNFLLLESVSQSLAGRTAILHLLPLSLPELEARKAEPITALTRRASILRAPRWSLAAVLFAGFYPRIHDRHLPPREWLGSYYQTYLERDVRQIVGVGDLEAFSRFVRLCAGRHGQLLNLSSLAVDCGITHTTARRWLSVLVASFIVMLLQPYHRNFNKRLIKAPKLYFLDSGLVSFLLNIRSAGDLEHHAMRGAIFEGFVISELVKRFMNAGEMPPLWFWRDSAGHEVDVVIEDGTQPTPIEIKSGQTVTSDYFTGLAYWRRLPGNATSRGTVIFGGDESYVRSGVLVQPWFAV